MFAARTGREFYESSEWGTAPFTAALLSIFFRCCRLCSDGKLSISEKSMRIDDSRRGTDRGKQTR